MFFFAIRFLHFLTLSANRREHNDYEKLLINGDIFTNIKVLLSPPNIIINHTQIRLQY
jgi:hypothetical protein